MRTFEQDIQPELLRFGALQRIALETIGRFAEKALKFPGVGREDAACGDETLPVLVFAQDVQRIGVENQGACGFLQ